MRRKGAKVESQSVVWEIRKRRRSNRFSRFLTFLYRVGEARPLPSSFDDKNRKITTSLLFFLSVFRFFYPDFSHGVSIEEKELKS